MDDFTGADISAAMSGGSEPAPASDTGTPAPATTTAEPTAQPGAATTQPAVATPTPAQPAKPQGPIPFDVHHKALENARLKEREEYDRQYGWAKGLNKADYDAAVAIARRAQTDPAGYITQLIDEANADPHLQAQLRSEMARRLASVRSTPEPQPDVTITDEHGNAVERTYSAAQWAKREAWLKEQWMGEVRKEIAPLVQTHKTIEAQRQRDHDEAEGQKFASGLVGELKDYPHFDAKKKEIGADVVRQIQALGDDPRTNDPAWLEAATMRAYHRVVTANLDALSRQAAVHDLTTKAGNSGVTPGRPPVGAPRSNTTGRFTGADLAAEFNARKLG